MLRFTCIAATILIVAHQESEGQEALKNPVVLAGTPSCERCQIQIEPTAELRPPAKLDIDPAAVVAVNGKGDYFVTGLGRASILVFDPNGRFKAVAGREGDGPGELRGLTGMVFDSYDSLYAFESVRRAEVFAPALTSSRRMTLPGPFLGAIVEPDGTILLNSMIATRDLAGLPVHVLSRNGAVLRSFGVEGRAEIDPRCSACAVRRAAKGQANHVWILAERNYRIERWTDSGRLDLRFVVPRSSWFKASSESSQWLTGRVPRPTILATAFERGRLLWIVGYGPSDNWHPSDGVRSRTGETKDPVRAAIEYTEANSRTFLDVFDLSTQKLVTSVSVAGLLRVNDTGLAWRFVEDATGTSAVRIYRLALSNDP
jgi:hypothetical protein